MNDRELLGPEGVNSRLQNLTMGVVAVICVALGLRGVVAAARSALAMIS